MTNPNILILSAGRRVNLVKNFQKTLNFFFPEAIVFTCDINPELSTACFISKKTFKVPSCLDPNYLNTILEIVKNNNIKLIIPTIDTELAILSANTKKFLKYSCKIIISKNKFISLCRDKRKTKNICDKFNFKYPKIYNPNDLKFPCFCKPYDGSNSKNNFKILSNEQISFELINDPKNIFMEYIPNDYLEYTCDLYYDKFSRLKCIVPRERISTRSGEVNKGVTRKNFIYEQIKKKISVLPGAMGCITLQLFANMKTNETVLIEINPRFGGGYPLTLAAGANFAKWLIEEHLLDKEIQFFDGWTNNLLMIRYDEDIFIKNYAI